MFPIMRNFFDHFGESFNILFDNFDETFAENYGYEETADEIIFSLEMPGFNKEAISVLLEGNRLKISAERKSKNGSRKIDRAFILPSSVDIKKIESEYKDGVLIIKAKKLEEEKFKGVKIVVN